MSILSIIIINYNSIQYTINCIESILSTQQTLDYEIILVDNASSTFDEKLIPVSSKITFIKSDTNLGFAKGNNLGIAHAKGEFILLLNNDTIVNENSIIVPLEKLKENMKIGAISCQLKYPTGEIQHNCQSFPSKWKTFLEKCRIQKLFPAKLRSRFFQGFYFDYSQNGNPDWIWGTFFMFRKETLQKLPNKKLNDDYFMYMEDMHWCWDIRKAGYEIQYLSSVNIIHFGGGSGANSKKLMEESMQIFMNRK